MSKGVNIREVAKAAGVSVATVSGILNQSGRISPATSARVRQVMQDLNYVPRRNRLRKKDPKGSTMRVGLLFPDVNQHASETPLSKGLANGLQKVLAEQNIQVHIFTFRLDGSLPEEIACGNLDGLVVRSGTTDRGGEDRLNRDLKKIGIPTVWTFGMTSSPMSDLVMVDDRGSGIWAADQVIPELTGKVIMVLPAGNRNIDLEYRAIAFQLHLQNRGFPAAHILRKTPATLPKALETIGEATPVTLFIPGHDSLLFVAHQALAKRKKSVRATDALIAVMTTETTIPPSMVGRTHILHIDPRRIGMAAGQQLLWRLQNPWAEPAHLLIPAKELCSSPSGPDIS